MGKLGDSPVAKDLQQPLLAGRAWGVLAWRVAGFGGGRHKASQCVCEAGVVVSTLQQLEQQPDAASSRLVYKPPQPAVSKRSNVAGRPAQRSVSVCRRLAASTANPSPVLAPLTLCRLLVETIPLLLAAAHITRHKVLQQRRQSRQQQIPSRCRDEPLLLRRERGWCRGTNKPCMPPGAGTAQSHTLCCCTPVPHLSIAQEHPVAHNLQVWGCKVRDACRPHHTVTSVTPSVTQSHSHTKLVCCQWPCGSSSARSVLEVTAGLWYVR